MWLQLVATSLFTSHREEATCNCSPVVISCGPVQLPVQVKSCNWTLKHYSTALSTKVQIGSAQLRRSVNLSVELTIWSFLGTDPFSNQQVVFLFVFSSGSGLFKLDCKVDTWQQELA